MISVELGEGVLLSTEMFKFDGSVDPKPQIDVRDFEIGFVQMLADTGGQRRIFESTVQRSRFATVWEPRPGPSQTP
jgi:hypothetical protein